MSESGSSFVSCTTVRKDVSLLHDLLSVVLFGEELVAFSGFTRTRVILKNSRLLRLNQTLNVSTVKRS